jgi:hypothetical protein
MSTEDNQSEYVVIWEQPKMEPPEFRLYYDANGAVICYTGDKSMTGNYIVIDAQTFATARADIRVIDGRISTASPKSVVYKLMPDKDEGVECIAEDVSIIADIAYDGKTTKWKLNIYELE